MNQDDMDYKRIFIAMALAGLVLIGYQSLVEYPRRQAFSHVVKQQAATRQAETQAHLKTVSAGLENNTDLPRTDLLASSPRLAISSDALSGSIALKGARFDDLVLTDYHQTIDPDSPGVVLFSPGGSGSEPYFAEVGWVATDEKTKVPDANSLWQADKKKLGSGETVHLSWNNGQNIIFILSLSLDQNYMFTINQHVENHSGHAISIAPYAYINRAHVEPKQSSAIMHEGPLGVLDGSLQEIKYKDLRDKDGKTFEHSTGWLGITDKYWLAALIPGQPDFKASFSHYTSGSNDRYQTDYLGENTDVANNASSDSSVRLFAGAKVLSLLDSYAAGDAAHNAAPIPLFDRAVDFGALYFLTKPIFLMLNFFYKLVGNFGVAILLLTIIVKMVMFPVANKSFKSAAQMRRLQPEMLKIRERYGDDAIKMQQETMALYKREKVNPAAGCLPIFIQMPVFFALYKVLFVTIEMRQAPFFGWIHDLSALDPSNVFTLFGLIPWNPPEYLHLGILPMLYCATMVIQMRMQPKPADPVQAKIMNYMPFIFLYVFSKFAAGLVIYWVWSNSLSIIQQQFITRRYKASQARAVA